MSTIDRIIEVRVSGSYLTRDSQTAGVQGEANAAALRIEFDPGWDGMAKTLVWWNARGEQEVRRILTADLLEDITANPRVYLAPIPAEAMTEAGKCRFAIDGYVAGKRQRSVYGELVVLPVGGQLTAEEDPTPTQAEQLQTQLDTVLETLQKAAEGVDSAAESAAEASASSNRAASSEQAASRSAHNAASSEFAAANSAEEAKSYARGGTGYRAGEDQDNAKYYMEQARKMAGGDFLTAEDLEERLDGLTAAELGAAAAGHKHAAGDITSGTLAAARLPTVSVSKGGTGRTSLTAGSYLVGNGTSTVSQKTPAQVLTDIGAAAAGHSHTAASVGAVPVGRAVNGKALSADIQLTAADVGARSETWLPTASEVGARSSTWLPTAAEVGAIKEKRYEAKLLAAGWYEVAITAAGSAAGSQVLVMLGSSYNSDKPEGVTAVVTMNATLPAITILHASNTTTFTKLRLVRSSDGKRVILEAYYAPKDGNNTCSVTLLSAYVAYEINVRNFVASTAAESSVLDGTECTIRKTPGGTALTSGNTYKELGLFPRFRRTLTKTDDLDQFKEDGVIVYTTDSPPANAPFPNASVGLCFGSDDAARQRIQWVMRYGAAGYMRFRTYTGSAWTPWADVLTSVNVVASRTDITAGSSADWQQYLVYE